MQTTTQAVTGTTRHEHADDDRAFFYVDGVPTKGMWLDLDDISDWSDVHEALQCARLIRTDYGGDILVADIEGAITRCCYTSRCDVLYLDRYIDMRDDIARHDLDRGAVAAFAAWYGPGCQCLRKRLHGPL